MCKVNFTDFGKTVDKRVILERTKDIKSNKISIKTPVSTINWFGDKDTIIINGIENINYKYDTLVDLRQVMRIHMEKVLKSQHLIKQSWYSPKPIRVSMFKEYDAELYKHSAIITFITTESYEKKDFEKFLTKLGDKFMKLDLLMGTYYIDLIGSNLATLTIEYETVFGSSAKTHEKVKNLYRKIKKTYNF